MKCVDFLLSWPGFDFCLTFECRGFGWLLFGIEYFYRFMRAGISATFATFMNVEPSLRIGRDAGIEAVVSTEEDIDVVHEIKNNTKRLCTIKKQ